MDGTPVFLGCSDIDPHIPKARVQLTADVFERLGAQVTIRLYPNLGHTIIDDEIEAVQSMILQVTER
jgi:predicted esterase